MRLSQARIEALLTCVAATEEVTDLAELPARMLTGVASLVACDSATYNEVDPGGRTVTWLADPSDATDLPDGPAIFTAHLHEHPVIAHHARTPTAGSLMISDFLTPRAFRRTSLYQEFFRPLKVRHQIAVTLPASDGLVIGIALDRATRDFSPEDREVLNLVRPHLVHARANALARAEAALTIAALERAVESEGQGVVLLDARGRVGLVTPAATKQLRGWFPEGPVGGRALPPALDAWVVDRLLAGRDGGRRSGRAASPLRLRRGSRQLTVRLLPRSAGGDPPLLLLDERRLGLSDGALRALGLTAREAEVLRCAACGQTNAQVARELHVSPATVKKHLEHIYRKLDVTHRSAAAAKALALDASSAR